MSRSLKRSLGLPQLIFYGVGTMVGAGIYSVIGAAAGEAGTNLWISFVLAGFAAFLTVLSYAELIAAFPKAGAEYQFIKQAFPELRLLAFMAGFMIALNAAATSATVALAFSGYLDVFLSVPALPTAFALLALCTAVNIIGIRESTWVSMGLICVEIIGLLLVIWAGANHGDLGKSFTALPSLDNAAGIFTATALIFFIYIGFEDVANLAEETHAPDRTVPRALIASIIVTGILYLLVACAVIALAAPGELAKSDAPLFMVTGRVAPWMGQMTAISALFATASTALISLISISRMLFGMARDGDMPQMLAKLLPRRRTPWLAALTLFAAACLLLPLGEIKTVASVSSFGVLLVFASVHIAMIRLRFAKPNVKRPFRVPLSIGRLPLLPILGLVLVLALATQFEPIVYMIGGGAMASGVAIYLLMKRQK